MASKIVIALIFIFDVVAFGLAVAAERRRHNGDFVPEDNDAYYGHCIYHSDISTGYGVGALLLLFASQFLLMVVTQCFCCGKALRPVGSRAWAILLFIVCWLFFLIAEICLLAGSVRNAYHTRYREILGGNDPPTCETLRKGVFAAGAAFTFLNMIVSEFYYICHSKAKSSPDGF